MPTLRSRLPVLLLLPLTACMSFRYDLTSVPFPVMASPAPADAGGERFEVSEKAVLWVHGLFGESSADVAAIVREAGGECAGVAEFRAGMSGTFHDWLVTHLTLGLVRIKTVTVSGVRLPARRS